MYGDVNVSIEDGNIGSNTNIGVGVQVKIGICGGHSTKMILINNGMTASKIVEKLGNSPLADACIDAVEYGADQIYCIPVEASIVGTKSIGEHMGTGTGTILLQGDPANAFVIVVEIIESGVTNVGTFRYSITGGVDYSEELTIPLSGSYSLPETGLTITFGNGAGESFVKGDAYSFTTTAPAMSNQDVLNAITSLININVAFEFVHVVGASTKVLWASLAQLAKDFVIKYHRPLWFVVEARGISISETIDQYAEAMLEDISRVSSIYIQVVLARSNYLRQDGSTCNINNAGMITGLYCRAKESQSIGEVKSFAISSNKLLKLLPEGIEDYIKVLDSAGYVTIRQYAGREDYYVTSANMLAPEGSDYRYAEDVRVLNRLVKAVRSKAIDELQIEIDPSAIEVSVAFIEAELNIPIEDALQDKIISAGKVTLDTKKLDILADETMNVTVSYVPMGHLRVINITFAVENPYAG